jgi:hypothetical protein
MTQLLINDLEAILRRAIGEARNVGRGDSAAVLEERCFAAYPTSSEWLGEIGLAIREFQNERHQPTSPVLERELTACLSEVRKVWPEI